MIPNHTDRCDPLTLFSVSKYCGEQFYYVAARECFDEDFGMSGLLFQNVGAYSVTRGVPDVQYLRETVALIKRHKRKIVMWAEGELTGRDDYSSRFGKRASV